MIHILIAIVLAAPPLELVDQLRSDTGGIYIIHVAFYGELKPLEIKIKI